MPATIARAIVGDLTVQVNSGGPHAPEDFNSDLYAEKVAELLNEFGYEGTFTIFPGNLHKGGGRPRQFGKMFVHGTNNSEGINCSANFEEKSDRHFAFALALPGLETNRTLLQLKGHLDRKYKTLVLEVDDQELEESPLAATSVEPEPELELIPLSDIQEALAIRDKATRDAEEARQMLDEAEGQIALADSVIDRAKVLVAEIPDLQRLEDGLYAKLTELQAKVAETQENLDRVQTQIANRKPLEKFLSESGNGSRG